MLFGFPRWLTGKEPICNGGDTKDTGSNPGLGRSPGEGNGSTSSILAWEISWTKESGRFPSMGSQRIGHDWAQHSMDPSAVNRIM